MPFDQLISSHDNSTGLVLKDSFSFDASSFLSRLLFEATSKADEEPTTSTRSTKAAPTVSPVSPTPLPLFSPIHPRSREIQPRVELLYDQIEVEHEQRRISFNYSVFQVCHTCQEDFDYILDPEDMMPSDSMEHEYITQYIRPQRTRKEVMSSLQARRGEVKMDMAPIEFSTPPSQWLQSGRVRTYQDIIRGRLRGKKESEREVLPWRRDNTVVRRRGEREKARDRFSMLEGEDTWSGSSDWVENRLGQDWTNVRAETEPSGSSIPELRDLFPSLSYSA